VDTSFFKPLEEPQNEKRLPLILCVARHVEVKRLSLLMEVCTLLRNRGIQFRCILAGNGPLRPQLLRERASRGLDDVMEMPGAIDQEEVCRYWQRAAIGILTSDNEGMPVCLMEAAACGVPVVATAVGGVPELVQDGVTGILCSRGNANEIANAIELLLADQQL